jgi:hypothetical protein
MLMDEASWHHQMLLQSIPRTTDSLVINEEVVRPPGASAHTRTDVLSYLATTGRLKKTLYAHGTSPSRSQPVTARDECKQNRHALAHIGERRYTASQVAHFQSAFAVLPQIPSKPSSES